MRAKATRFARIIAILSLSSLLATAGVAAEFSSEPIRFIVGYPAGGSTDIAARLMVDKVAAETGRRLIVDNRPGASGIVAAGVVANAAADAPMVLFAASPEVALARALNRKIDYDPQASFRPVTLVGKVPFMLAINNDVPAKNLQEFIAYVRQNPRHGQFCLLRDRHFQSFVQRIFQGSDIDRHRSHSIQGKCSGNHRPAGRSHPDGVRHCPRAFALHPERPASRVGSCDGRALTACA